MKKAVGKLAKDGVKKAKTKKAAKAANDKMKS